jgi:hypothetical protein
VILFFYQQNRIFEKRPKNSYMYKMGLQSLRGMGMLLDNIVELSSTRVLSGGLLIFFCGIHLWLFYTDTYSNWLLVIGIVLGGVLIIWKVRDRMKKKNH